MLSSSFAISLLAIGRIVLVDLILSGDNALVIGAAASFVPQRYRLSALIGGGGVAIVLRILFTSVASFLLKIPYLQATGGLLVLFIATRLIIDSRPAKEANEAPLDAERLPSLARRFVHFMQHFGEGSLSVERRNFLLALGTITIADITMSLDNIIAVGALAAGQFWLLIIGLGLSIVLLLLGSALVSEIIRRVPGMIVIASLILALVAADLIWNDAQKLTFINQNTAFWWNTTLYILTFAVVGIYILQSGKLYYQAYIKRRSDKLRALQTDADMEEITVGQQEINQDRV